MPKQRKPNQPKQPRLSKEQVKQQVEARAKSDLMKKAVRELLYPVILKAGTVKQAKQICEVARVVMTAKMSSHWADKTVNDLGLLEELEADKEAKDTDIYRELFEAIAALPIGDAQKLLEGMNGALDHYFNKIADATEMSSVAVDDIING